MAKLQARSIHNRRLYRWPDCELATRILFIVCSVIYFAIIKFFMSIIVLERCLAYQVSHADAFGLSFASAVGQQLFQHR